MHAPSAHKSNLTVMLLAVLTLLLLPGSLAEHGKGKHKHLHRQVLAPLEPRHMPAAFDALQWKAEDRRDFNTNGVASEPVSVIVDIVTEIETIYVPWSSQRTSETSNSQHHHHHHHHTWKSGSSSVQTSTAAAISSTHAVVSSTSTSTLQASSSAAQASSSAVKTTTSIIEASSSVAETSSSVVETSSSVVEASSSTVDKSSSTIEVSTSAIETSSTLRTTSTTAQATSATSEASPSSTHEVTSATETIAVTTSTRASTSTSQVLSTSDIVHVVSTTSKATSATVEAVVSTTSSKAQATTSVNTATVVPTATYSLVHGAATYSPASQWIDSPAQSLPTLSSAVLSTGITNLFQTEYSMYNGSGPLQVTSSDQGELKPLDTVPHYCRDGGHGGVINGYKFFYFADTMMYSEATDTVEGKFTGAASNSFAIDVGNNAFDGKALTLQDPIGAMAGASGNTRNFIPWTTGEAAYNNEAGGGDRYAIWPWSSMVPLTNTTSLLYAPLVYVQGGSKFSNAGVTLAEITVTDDGQPIVDRTNPMLFDYKLAQYGGFAGIRSWGPSGIGGSDGMVYLFASSSDGLLLARADAGSVTDSSSYEFWDKSTTPASWSSTPTTDVFVSGSFGSGDLIFSPRHGTFLLIYQDKYIDSKFLYSYLLTPDFITPAYSSSAYRDIVADITAYEWSDPELLIETPVLAEGKYTYDGGVHLGYFEEEDVINGGDRMLLAWTAPTDKNAALLDGGDQIWTAEVRWN